MTGPPHRARLRSFNRASRLVEMTGLEPATTCLLHRCAPIAPHPLARGFADRLYDHWLEARGSTRRSRAPRALLSHTGPNPTRGFPTGRDLYGRPTCSWLHKGLDRERYGLDPAPPWASSWPRPTCSGPRLCAP